MTTLREERIDVAIVGGGVIGLAVAHALATRGRAVTVIEAARIGQRAAAGVAAGMLAPSSEADLSDPRLTTFALASHALYPAWTAAIEAASGLDTGFEDTGTLMVALHADHLSLIEHLHAFQRERGLTAERLTAKQARAEEPYLAPGIAGALRMPDAQVDPRRLLRALAAAIERAGGRIEESARVRGVTTDGAGYAIGIEHVDGAPSTLRATQVVIAAGAWARQITADPHAVAGEGLPLLQLPMRPVKGQILRLRGERLVRHVIRTPDVYLVPRADGELVVGATMEEMGFDARPTAGAVHDLLREARRALPGIAELELAECGVGFRPALRDHLPAIGNADGAGLFVTAGHFRDGVELAPITARLLADLICDGRLDPLLAPFAPDRFAPAHVEAAR